MLDLNLTGVLRSCSFNKLTYNIENIYVIKTHYLSVLPEMVGLFTALKKKEKLC